MNENVISIAPDTLFHQNPDLITSPLADELIILNLDPVAYFGLNEVATDIWNQLAQPRRFADLVDTLLERYDVDREQCEHDTRRLLALMHQHDIVVIPGS